MKPLISFALALISMFAAFAGPAHAQSILGGSGPLGAPALPDLPQLPNPGGIVQQTQDLPVVRDVRRLRLNELLRANPKVLEAGPKGSVIVRGEIMAVAPTAQTLEQARALGLVVGRTEDLQGIGETVVVWRTPPGMQTKRALQKLREADPQGLFDYNHIYTESGSSAPAAPSASIAAQATPDLGRVRIGLVDGGVGAHPSLADGVAAQRAFAGEKPLASAHGTAIASLLVGRQDAFHGAAPGGRLYAADVYGGAPDGGSSFAVARALSWLASERTPVINVSLVGPSNRVLERIIARLVAQGFVIVAAVGNDGPAAPPLYPAAYPGVIGVTGVDARNRVLLETGRGAQVAFAAPGADMAAASGAKGYSSVRGTSFAAPIVAGLIAAQMKEPDAKAASAVLGRLRASAQDLGAKGMDQIYGAGLVGADLRMKPVLASR